MSINLEKLKKNRAVLRTAITKLTNNIETIMKEENIDFDSLEESLNQLNIKSSTLTNVDKEIETLSSVEEYENEISTVYEYSDKISLTIFRANKKLKENKKLIAPVNNNSSEINCSMNENRTIKLPKLNLQKFYGDYTLFNSFWNSFKVAIHENENLNKIDKFNYLKSYLASSALSAIEGLDISEDNYDAAIEILHSRFGNREIIINNHMNKLLNLSPVYKSTDTFKLKKLHDEIQINVRALSALGIDSNSYGPMLLAVILKILPQDLTLEYNKRRIKNKKESDINDLLDFLLEEILCREKTSFNKIENRKFQLEDKNKINKLPKKEHSTIEFVTTTEEPKKKNFCFFCNGRHPPEICDLEIEKKRDILKRQGRCYRCLLRNHVINSCKSTIKCECGSSRHNKTICFKSSNSQNSHDKLGETKTSDVAGAEHNQINQINESNKNNQIITATTHVNKNKILLQTCFVRAKNKLNNRYFMTRMLLDCGSMRSFISKEMAIKLRLKIIRKENLSVFTFGSKNPITKNYDVVKLTLENKSNSRFKIDIEALIVDEISGQNIPPPDVEHLMNNEKMKKLTLADPPLREDTPIQILIGADYYYDIVTGQIQHITKTLVAVETIFGHCLQGRESENYASLVFNVIIEENEISNQIKKFWDLETSGLIDTEKDSNPYEDEVLKRFESEIEYKNKRYEIKLPWKTDKSKLSDNRKIAEQRFERLRKKFLNNPELFREYNNILKDYLKQKIIEIVPDVKNEEKVTFYLPHREIIKKDRITSKLRIVFDASSHDTNSLSLNSCLHTGPNLYPEIFDILLRFRLHMIAFTTDMKQAFLQISVNEDDRDVTRFLFSENPLDETEPPLIYRFTRVIFGVNSSPFLLAATIKHHLKKYADKFPETVQFLNENIYVDDIIGSFSSIETALSVTLQSTEIFKEASIKLHKWNSNSEPLKNLWRGNNIISENDLEMFEEKNSPYKVLGMSWDSKNDLLYFDFQELINFVSKQINTKRYILQAVGRIFDPVGFLGPFTVRAKCLIQKIWNIGIDWDDPLPTDLTSEWRDWCGEISKISLFSVPRYYFGEIIENKNNKFELHMFSDSSVRAFGTVAYLRIETPDENIRTAFIASKNRVAPMKTLTLPRLELMAALLSARLSNSILKALKMDIPCVFWTDSKITFFWIKGSPEKFKPFVKNRIQEIQKLTSPSNWYHCPGTDNPADLVSRGTKITKILEDPIWLSGPKWLSLPPEFWPKSNDENVFDEDELEYRKMSKNILQCECITDKLEPPIDITKYSSLEKLLRITGLIKRFIKKLKKCEATNGPLTSEEILEAERFWINHEQKKYFTEEIESLKKNNKVEKESSLYYFMPYLDHQGLMRLGGRLEFCNLTIEEKHPLILPRDSWLSVLIIRKEHHKVMHGGMASTLAQVRTNFWIPRGRQLVRKVIKNCFICRKYLAKPADQVSAPLPIDRISQTPAFSVCGLDFAGPLYIKNPSKAQKSYILLITCGVTRALHLELVPDMTTNSFLLAFRRFLARRGNCKVIYSDNAKTFLKGKKELEKLSSILCDNTVKDFICKERIIWKNIIERAPWWGGFYERLVKSVKECLHKILGKALLNYDEMHTILTEIEAVLNLRPLSYVYDENDEPRPLTPMHFLNFGQNQPTYPLTFGEILEIGSTKSSLTKRKTYQQLLFKQLWHRWKKQYLLDLRTAHSLKNPVTQTELKPGTVVLIEDNIKNKLLWKLGRVEKAFLGRDNKIRCYELKTDNGLLKRTIQHLYPLEL